MKAILFALFTLSCFLLAGCGQYGGLYLPPTKSKTSVLKKTTNDNSVDTAVKSDTPP